MNRSLAVLALASCTVLANAQSTIKDSLVKHWKTSGEFTLAVAKAMPAESYSFRPVPEEMTFAQLMGQVALANANACTNASGMSAPSTPDAIKRGMEDQKGEIDKDTVVSFLTTTFDFCNQAVASMTPEKLDAVVGTRRKMTGFEWLWAYFTHTAHHRGQAEVYLRLKGIKPPNYTF